MWDTRSVRPSPQLLLIQCSHTPRGRILRSAQAAMIAACADDAERLDLDEFTRLVTRLRRIKKKNEEKAAAESGEGEGEAGILGVELQTKVPEDFTITEKAPF